MADSGTLHSTDLFKIKVTQIVDPLNFWAHIGTVDSFRQCQEYEEIIQDYCRSDAGVFDDLNFLTLSDIVFAKSSQTDRWLRAETVSVDINSQEVDVRHIDYGTSEFVGVDSLRLADSFPIDPHSWPPMASRCKLTDVRPLARTWVSRAVSYFSGLVLDKVLDAQILDCENSILVVDIIIDLAHSITSVSEHLIKEAFALSCKPDTSDGMPNTFKNVDSQKPNNTIPPFDLSALPRKSKSKADGPGQPAKEDGEDIEVELFRKGLDRTTSFEWKRSDTTIGEEYRPNMKHDVLTTIYAQIKEMQKQSQTRDGSPSNAECVPLNVAVGDSPAQSPMKKGPRGNKVEGPTNSVDVKTSSPRMKHKSQRQEAPNSLDEFPALLPNPLNGGFSKAPNASGVAFPSFSRSGTSENRDETGLFGRGWKATRGSENGSPFREQSQSPVGTQGQ